MKKLLIFGILLLFITSVNAETTPFEQCIKVVDNSNSPKTGLDCTFTDSVPYYNNVSMNEGTAGYYCTTINGTFPVGTFTFTSFCSDGVATRSVSGSFEVEEVVTGGGDNLAPPNYYEAGFEPEEGNIIDSFYRLKNESGTLTYALSLFVLVAFIFGVFTNKRKKPRRFRK